MLANAEQKTTDVVKIQTSLTLAKSTLTTGQAALKALVSIPGDIAAATDSIDRVAQAGIAITVATTAPQGFSAATAPKGGGPPPTAKSALAAENDSLVSATAAVQAILNKVDYVNLDNQIKSAAPAVNGATTAKSSTTTSPGPAGGSSSSTTNN
jgi:hypothetical protein